MTKQLFFAGWWVVWTALQFAVMLYYSISIRESWMDASVTSSVVVLAGYVMISIVKYFRPSARNAIVVLVSALALAALSGTVLYSLLKMLPSGPAYLTWLDDTLLVRLVFIWLMIIIAGINGWLFSYVKEYQQNELREKETGQLMREAELSGLRQQFQPHFIFNSLNSISALAGTNPALARKMIEQLSDFLRGTVKKENSQFVSLRDELRHLQLYLDIEKVRFGHRLTADIKTEDAALEMTLPSLLLQPILENAIKFGLYDTLGEVVISLEAKPDNNNLMVEIKNPFDPASVTPNSGTGFGLSSIQRRLSLLFFRNDLLTTRQNENTFTTSIKIPQR
ncbi:MAG TPA: histidine kinase [Cyclobacteriaceae bacterium]|nr:histidine kinase [Cyclobacteriaceae bacterium]